MNKEKFLINLQELDKKFSELKPELELTVRDDNIGLEGYVVVYNTFAAINGPLGRIGKGGTRVTPATSLDEIKMLANIMTLKNAAAGLPLGGAKSGIKADPNSPDFEVKFKRYVELVKPLLAENGGIWGGLGFDIGMKTQQLIWACQVTGSNRCATGKPIELGGTDYDKEGIAGLGVAVAAATTAERFKENLSTLSYAVQGVGAMGAAVIKYFSEYGPRLTAVSDPILGGTYKFNTYASSQLITALGQQNFNLAKELLSAEAQHLDSSEDVLFVQSDFLFPCALQGVIHENNVDKIKSRYLIEAANNPCNALSRKKLYERGVILIPDFIANPGGIVAAFVEMSSNISIEENIKEKTKVQEAKKYTKSKIAENTLKVLELMDTYSVSGVDAGRYLALSSIFNFRS